MSIEDWLGPPAGEDDGPCEPISDEELKNYFVRDTWAHFESLFLLHGYKVKGDFLNPPDSLIYFTDIYNYLSIDMVSGAIGRKEKFAGNNYWFASPAEWYTYGKRKQWRIDPRFDVIFSQDSNTIDNSNLQTELSSKTMGANSTEFRLNIQRERDGWAPAIRDAAESLFNDLGQMPNSAQVWNQLLTNPPKGYGINVEAGMLTMPSENPLSQKDFNRRWKKYAQISS